MKKKLLIVVDYQNDFVTGSLGFPAAVDIEDSIAAKIEKYRGYGEGGQVIFTMDTHGKNYMETLHLICREDRRDAWPLQVYLP